MISLLGFDTQQLMQIKSVALPSQMFAVGAERQTRSRFPKVKLLGPNALQKLRSLLYAAWQARPGPARPSEPILFPKVRIEFADFPYLHVSDSAEATNLGDQMRI